MAGPGSGLHEPIYRADTAMRRQLVASLRLQQLSPDEIVAKLTEVECLNPKTREPWSVDTIKADLSALAADWRKASRVAMSEHVAEALATLKEIQKVAWTRGDLDSVLKAIDKQMKLLGLSAPQAISITTKERADELAQLLGCTREELLQVAKAFAEGEAP